MSTPRKPSRPPVRKSILAPPRPTRVVPKQTRPIRNKRIELESKEVQVKAEMERLQREIEEAPIRQAAENEKRKREVMMRATVIDRPIDARFHDDHDDFFQRRPPARRQMLKSEARAARHRFFVLSLIFIVIALALYGFLRS